MLTRRTLFGLIPGSLFASKAYSSIKQKPIVHVFEHSKVRDKLEFGEANIIVFDFNYGTRIELIIKLKNGNLWAIHTDKDDIAGIYTDKDDIAGAYRHLLRITQEKTGINIKRINYYDMREKWK